MSVVDADLPDVLVPREDFAVFYEREFQPVVALAFALCGSWSSAEDLTQDAFVSAQRQWSKIGAYDKPGAWVRRAVANRSVSLTRRRISEGRALLRMSRERSVEPSALADSDREFWQLVRELPARQRQVIALHYVGGHPVAEIAATLELSESTVKTHLQRARKMLERQLTIEGPS